MTAWIWPLMRGRSSLAASTLRPKQGLTINEIRQVDMGDNHRHFFETTQDCVDERRSLSRTAAAAYGWRLTPYSRAGWCAGRLQITAGPSHSLSTALPRGMRPVRRVSSSEPRTLTSPT